MDIEFLGDLLYGFDALERFKRHSSLEFGFVSSSFCVDKFQINIRP